MKQFDGWWWPDHERHLLDWMANPKGRMVLNGRSAYQGRKQVAALALVPADKRRTAIDVGGHCGTWSWNLAHWFKKVEAFEPVPEHRECFNVNVTQDNVTLHPYALGDREGTVSISTEDGSSGNSFVKGHGRILMKTLDSFGFENVDFAKIDVEGYEEFVLRGGEQMIERWKPVVVVEQKRSMSQERFGLKPLSAVKFLIDLGYKVADEISGDYFLVPA